MITSKNRIENFALTKQSKKIPDKLTCQGSILLKETAFIFLVEMLQE